MSILKAQSMFSSSRPSSILNNRSKRYYATLQVPISPKNKGLSIPKLPLMINAEKLGLKKDTAETNLMQKHAENTSKKDTRTKLYTVLEAVADRAEMHSIIGHQRNDWNKLFLTSINSITLTASLLAAISSINPSNGLNISSTILFGSAAILMLLINKLQPSQLAEEQTKATQLFKQLQNSIHTAIAIGTPTEQGVEDFMQKVLAIDQAYPLPLLPLLEKFPKKVEGARWWPQAKSRSTNSTGEDKENNNGWSDEMEQEMRGVLRVMKEKDEVQYRECGELAVKINKVLAVAGPVLAGMAAIGSSQISNGSSWGVLLATVGGAAATVVNTMEHGGQIGMVFELFRNNVGFFNYLEEEIESNLGREVNEREDGELFRMKMALKLGRSIPEMKELASYASDSTLNEDIGEFASKLF